MSNEIEKSGAVLEPDLSNRSHAHTNGIDINKFEQVAIHVPLPSFGSSQSYRDLCGDLLDASWALETLAACAQSIEIKIASDKVISGITAVHRDPRKVALSNSNCQHTLLPIAQNTADRCAASRCFTALRQPFLASQSLDAIELAEIARHHDQPATARVARDQQIIAPDSPAQPLETGTDIGRVIGSHRVERQHLQSSREALDLTPVVAWPR
jgi:hypothetical protein